MLELINKYIDKTHFFISSFEKQLIPKKVFKTNYNDISEIFLRSFPHLEEKRRIIIEETIKKHFKNDKLFSAREILELKELSTRDKLLAVLFSKLIPDFILYEFECRYSEKILKESGFSDPKSLNAIRIKRLWLNGEATNKELDVARTVIEEAYPYVIPGKYKSAAYAVLLTLDNFNRLEYNVWNISYIAQNFVDKKFCSDDTMGTTHQLKEIKRMLYEWEMVLSKI